MSVKYFPIKKIILDLSVTFFFSLLYEGTNVFGLLDSVPEIKLSVPMKLFKSACSVEGERALLTAKSRI